MEMNYPRYPQLCEILHYFSGIEKFEFLFVAKYTNFSRDGAKDFTFIRQYCQQ